jgi:hypothetical protein
VTQRYDGGMVCAMASKSTSRLELIVKPINPRGYFVEDNGLYLVGVRQYVYTSQTHTARHHSTNRSVETAVAMALRQFCYEQNIPVAPVDVTHALTNRKVRHLQAIMQPSQCMCLKLAGEYVRLSDKSCIDAYYNEDPV